LYRVESYKCDNYIAQI